MDIQLHLGDCLGENGMRTLADKSVDMILADLPFSITINQWDTKIDLEAVFKEYMRVIKDNGVIVLFGVQPFTTDLINAGRKWFRYSLVWEKSRRSDFFNANRKPLRIHEDIVIFYKKSPIYNPQKYQGKPYDWIKGYGGKKTNNQGLSVAKGEPNKDGLRFPISIIRIPSVQHPKHPTQKPVPLLEWLIKTYTNETELVLDNTFGSGSTAVACKNTNRRFVGWETEKSYFDVAKERLELNDVKKWIYNFIWVIAWVKTEWRTLADKSVDMILADLPYEKVRWKWDKWLNLDAMWNEFKRVIKPQGVILLFAQQPFTSLLVSSNLQMYKYNYVWKKEKKTRFLLANYQPLKQTEDILVFSYGGASASCAKKGTCMPYHPPNLVEKIVDKVHSKKRLGKMLDNVGHLGENNCLLSSKAYQQKYTNYPCDILEFSVGKCNYHLTEKPVALLEWLIPILMKQS